MFAVIKQTHNGTARQRQAGRTWLIILILLIIVLSMSAGGFIILRRGNVQTIKVERGTVVKAFYATGTVRPNFEYPIKSKGQGILVNLLVREGDRVYKDQIVARVDDRQLRFEVERLVAELKETQAMAAENSPQRTELLAKLEEAKAQFEISEREMARVQKSFDQSAAAISDLDAARRGHVQWANTIAGLNSQLENGRVNRPIRWTWQSQVEQSQCGSGGYGDSFAH